MKTKHIKKIERRSVTCLKVPNTPEGQTFLSQLKKYKTAGTRLRIRGRGPRAAQAVADGRYRRGYDQDLPVAKSTSLAITLWKDEFVWNNRKMLESNQQLSWDRYSKIAEQEKMLASLANELRSVRNELWGAQRELASRREAEPQVVVEERTPKAHATIILKIDISGEVN